MVNSRGRWLTIRAEPTIRSDARLAQIVHYAVADELRNAEYGGEQPLMRRARRLRRPRTSPRYQAHDPL